MFFTIITLAFCSSIDSLGIGVSYGIRNIHISNISKLVLFFLSLLIASLSVFLGNIIIFLFPNLIPKYIGIFLLIVMGGYIIFNSFKNDSTCFDSDHSQTIDWKESIYLGIALSIDSICVGIGLTTLESHYIIFPIFVSILQLLFLSVGYYLGKHLSNISKIPDSIWSILSGILLIIIGLIKLI